MIWNWNAFSPIGYAGLAISFVVPALWAWAAVRRTTPAVVQAAVIVAVVALACGLINSATHVARLEPDHAAELAAAEAKRQARLEAFEEGRGSEVAQIRFAEDARDDAIDKAGLDEADLKYLEKIEEEYAKEATPEWKRQKQDRGSAAAEDDSLEAQLDDGADQPAGLAAEAAEPDAPRQPIVVPQAAFDLAHRVDRWNRSWGWLLVLGSCGVVVTDWLRRANSYEEAYLPLPLPSRLVNAVRPLPAIVMRPKPPRRTVTEELAWMLRRGDSFLYLAADPAAADAAIAALAPFERARHPRQVLRLGAAGEPCSDRFVFESLWYGRCSFVSDDPAAADRMTRKFCLFLDERQATGAHTRQTVHLVWDLSRATPRSKDEEAAFVKGWRQLIQAFAARGRRAGFSVLFCKEGDSASLSKHDSSPLARAS